ncbi:MAG: hypothetical protein U5K81_00095 [Trueperaceae bacterium]|nr:hypothetical protein [Trueperaceae bacterium]
MRNRLLFVLTLALIIPSLAAAQVDFTTDAEDRLFNPNYQLPDGWQELVGDTEEISHFNYGAMDFDPATLRNGDVYQELDWRECRPHRGRIRRHGAEDRHDRTEPVGIARHVPG